MTAHTTTTHAIDLAAAAERGVTLVVRVGECVVRRVEDEGVDAYWQVGRYELRPRFSYGAAREAWVFVCVNDFFSEAAALAAFSRYA